MSSLTLDNHKVIETPQPNLVAEMKWLLGTYTSRFNRRLGHLFRYNCFCDVKVRSAAG